jgi:hypothetical protein
VNEITTDDSTSPSPEGRRQAAIVAFLSAGIEPPPSTAVMVSALAEARRAVAATHAQEWAFEAWLGSAVRLGGVKENAATLAALEVPRCRDQAARAYAQRYPNRARVLTELLTVVARGA